MFQQDAGAPAASSGRVSIIAKLAADQRREPSSPARGRRSQPNRLDCRRRATKSTPRSWWLKARNRCGSPTVCKVVGLQTGQKVVVRKARSGAVAASETNRGETNVRTVQRNNGGVRSRLKTT